MAQQQSNVVTVTIPADSLLVVLNAAAEVVYEYGVKPEGDAIRKILHSLNGQIQFSEEWNYIVENFFDEECAQ